MSLSHWLLIAVLSGLSASAVAIDPYQFNSPMQEAQYQGLVAELRCPKCQNQNLAGSNAPIAQDLKQKTYEMVMDGQTDQQIRTYMIDRYGDFVTYRPPVRPSTWILWFFPPLLLVVVLVGWLVTVHRRQRQHATQQLSVAEQQRLQALLRDSRPAPSQLGQSQVGESHDA
jgi:cytochrome c-type biogenesis protein CcmH